MGRGIKVQGNKEGRCPGMRAYDDGTVGVNIEKRREACSDCRLTGLTSFEI
jgi:hypothetical protein